MIECFASYAQLPTVCGAFKYMPKRFSLVRAKWAHRGCGKKGTASIVASRELCIVHFMSCRCLAVRLVVLHDTTRDNVARKMCEVRLVTDTLYLALRFSYWYLSLHIIRVVPAGKGVASRRCAASDAFSSYQDCTNVCCCTLIRDVPLYVHATLLLVGVFQIDSNATWSTTNMVFLFLR